MLLFRSKIAERQIHPVRIGIIVRIGTCTVFLQLFISIRNGFAIVSKTLVYIGYCRIGIQFFGLFCQLGKTECTVVIDRHLAGFTLFGDNQQDTVGSTRTINSGGRSILQDGHLFDIFGIQVLKVSVFRDNIIDYHQRSAATTDRNGRSLTDTTTGRGYDDTRYLTGQCLSNVGGRNLSQVFRIDSGHSSGYLSFGCGTITYHNDFIQYFRIFFHDNPQVLFLADNDDLILISDIRNDDGSLPRNIQFKMSVKIGNHTVCGTFHHNRSTDNRFAVFIQNRTFDSFFLLLHNGNGYCICRPGRCEDRNGTHERATYS